MFYYAEINSSSVVIAVHSLSEAVTTETYIEITEEQYTNGALVGKGYDYYANEFFTVPAWMGPAYAVQYNDTCLPLTRKLDAIDRNIEATNAAMEIVQNVANEKADEDHTHSAATSSEGGFMSAADKVKLDGIATGANSYTHPATHPASMVTGLSPVATSGSYNDLTNKPSIPEEYSHPATHPASMITGLPTALPANGGNADTVDGKHATDFAAATHTHSNYAVTGHNHDTAYAGINHNHDSDYADVSHTHTQYAASSHTHSNYASSTHNHDADYADISHTHAQSEIAGLTDALGGKANTSHAHAQTDITGLSDALAGKANASHTHDYAATSHTHTAAALIGMASALFGTGEGGGVQYSYTSGDVLKAISAYPQGIHTVYAAAGCSTNPDSTESYRYLIHKTGTTIGWILAWGSEGSMYTNYQYGNNQFKGWRCLYDASPAPLWSGGANGGYYMTEGHTVTPSKKLSECRNGWLLLWSDYDAGANAQANNTDFCTTFIPKRAYTGQVWNGAMWYCDVPSYAAGTATDSEVRVIKVLQIYDAKIVGTANNSTAPRNDVVLRAVYEM